MKKVYLVDLGTGTTRNLLPLAAGLLVAYCQSKADIRKRFLFEIRVLSDSLESLADSMENAFVIGFSFYSWNALGTLRAAKLCKEKSPTALIVLGGCNVPCDPKRIGTFFKMNPFVDVLVHGEGEITFSELLLSEIDRRDFAGIKGLTYQTRDLPGFVQNAKRERIRDFAEFPSPYLTGAFDDLLERHRSVFYGVLWESNRGCPFRCTFCAWGDPSTNTVSKLNMDRALKELDWISKHNFDYVYNTDANFGMFFDRDMEFVRRLVHLKQMNGHPKEFVTNWTKNSHANISDLAQEIKNGEINVHVTLSLQSLNPKTVEAIKRRNIQFDDLAVLKRFFYKNNLPTYTEYILALPEETYTSFIDGLNRAPSPFLEDQLAVYLCTILENTEMSKPEYIKKYGIETRNCALGLNRRIFISERFGEETIVIQTSTMTNAEWQKCYILAYSLMAFYNLRIAFFVISYLREEFGIQYMDIIEFLHESATARPKDYTVFARAFDHLHVLIKNIMDGISSVGEVEGSEGVCFTPHEGMLFLFSSNLDAFYQELTALCRDYCRNKGLSLNEEMFAEVVKYQKIRMPVFRPEKNTHDFSYNIYGYFNALCQGEQPRPVNLFPNRLVIDTPPHDYATETEFNRRRVARGYSVQLLDCHPAV